MQHLTAEINLTEAAHSLTVSQCQEAASKIDCPAVTLRHVLVLNEQNVEVV